PRKENSFGRHVRSLQLLCQEMIRGVMMFSKTLMKVLQALCLGSSTIAWILAAYLLSLILILLLGLISVPDQGYITRGSSLEPELIVDGTYDLPRMLDDERHYCYIHESRGDKIPEGILSISQEDRDGLTSDYGEICAVLSNTSEDLRRYKRHINLFGDVISQPGDTINTKMMTASPKVTKTEIPLASQHVTNDRVSSFIESWQTIYDTLVAPGMRFARDLDYYRGTLGVLGSTLMKARTQVAGARQDVVNRWPLLRRIFRDIGLVTYEADEVSEHNRALWVLDPWLTATRRQENLLALVWSNVTAIHEELDAQVAAGISADAFVHFGPAAALNIQFWMTEIRQKARQTVRQTEREDARLRAKDPWSLFFFL
ncbi:MAG: hypothetical protein Q9204_007474, partial [Flavoplaca sp. TL-2023a]